MKNQWVKLENGDWNYYGDDGIKVVDKWLEIDDLWYCFDTDGKMRTGWWLDSSDGHWYYMYETSDSKTGQVKGSMAKSWLLNNGHYYYLAESSNANLGVYAGQMQVGWLQWNSKWYYLMPESSASEGLYKGMMLENCTRTIDGTSYRFGEDGSWMDDSSSSDSYISDDCLAFVKGWEGFTNNGAKYYDCCGVLTQGYGMTGDEIADLPDVISEETASAMLKELINKNYASVVKAKLDANNVTLTQNQFESLVTFAYNCGNSALFQSTLWKNVLSGNTDSSTILANFQAWSKGSVNGVMTTISGLLKRRNAECAIFTNSDYSGRP
jgi:lysozyme